VSEAGYVPRQIVSKLGIPYSTLNHWAKSGLVSPSICPGRGTGNERIYSAADVKALRVALSLKRAGIGLEITRLALAKLDTYPDVDCIELEIGSRRQELIRITINVQEAW
jgi:DNA-binding transcriptional MerR regulator